MSCKISTTRLLREYRKIQKDPPDYVTARPLEGNVLEWHYVISGPPGTPYENGIYHGVLSFPPGTCFFTYFFFWYSKFFEIKTEYPWKPPSIKMYTPSGRFEINRRLCLSMSGMILFKISLSLSLH